MKLALTPEQAAEARKAMAAGAERCGGDAILFGQIRLDVAGEEYAGELVLYAITIPPATGRKVRALLERERLRLSKEAKRYRGGVGRARVIQREE
jgi:hypothetical protein